MYHDNIPVSVAAIMDNSGAASLEFVGTIPGMRKKDLRRLYAKKPYVMPFLTARR